MRRFFYTKILKRPYYCEIPAGLLTLNWIVQRVFRVNSQVPYSVHFTSKVSGFNQIKMGQKAMLSLAISGGSFIKAFEGSKLTIGEETIFANNVTIHTGNHGLMNRNSHILEDIVIGQNCWLGSGVSVLAGSKIGNNVTVGANSVVKGEFPDNCVIAGVPAKIIKSL